MKQAVKLMSYQNNNLDSVVNKIGLILGLLNLQENLTQSDKQDIFDSLDKKSRELLTSIDNHLQSQDQKLDIIIKLLQS